MAGDIRGADDADRLPVYSSQASLQHTVLPVDLLAQWSDAGTHKSRPSVHHGRPGSLLRQHGAVQVHDADRQSAVLPTGPEANTDVKNPTFLFYIFIGPPSRCFKLQRLNHFDRLGHRDTG